MKHLTQEDLILYHYGEEVDRRAVEEHLKACRECSASLAGLTEMLAAVSELPVPERSEDYGREVYGRLRTRMIEQKQSQGQWSWTGFFEIRRWVAVGALGALTIGAFLSGRLWQSKVAPSSVAATPQARERILMVAVGDHLERSKMVLIELANAPVEEGAGKTVDISMQREWAADLVSDNRLFRQTAVQSGDVGVKSVLEELERILMDIANSPAKISPRDLDGLRKRIEDRGLLFKVKIIGSEIREKEKSTGPKEPKL